MAYRDEVLVDSPQDFYEMETSTGTDAGSGARTLTPTNVTHNVPGIIGNGWSFNGTTSTASMATFPGGATVPAKTFEAWIKAPSPQGMLGDYHTIIRRNGTDIMLIRVRGSNIVGGVNPGKAEVYLAGTTLLSTVRVDDGNWHHIVMTVSGNALKLYVDGGTATTATTSKTTYNMGTAAGYIGSDVGTSEFFMGTLDNVAVYNSALSATRVTAHYNAAFVTGGYTGQAMTVSAAFPGGVHPVARTVAVTPVTASAAMPGGKGVGTKTLAASRDAAAEGLGPSASQSNIANGLMFDFDLPADFATAGLASAKLRFYKTDSNTGTATVRQITQEWANDEAYAGTYSSGVDQTLTTATGWVEVDVTSILTSTDFYGFNLDSANSSAVIGMTEGGYQPTLVLAYESAAIPSGHSAQAMTADASMPDAVIGTAIGVTHAAEVMNVTSDMPNPVVVIGMGVTAAAQVLDVTADMPNPIVTGARLYSHNAERMDAYADMLEGAFAMPVTVTAEAMATSLAIVDPSVGTATGVIYYPEPLTATASIIKPALVNDEAIVIEESEDKYFNRVFNLAPKVWQRLNDSGSTAVDRMGTYNGTYNGVQVHHFDAPDGRHSVHFPLGSYLEQTEPTGTNADEAQIQDGAALATTLEFSFRTDKANTFLMAGADSTQTTAGVRSSYAAREVFLTGGKLTFRSRIFAGTPDAIEKEFTGVRNLADNQWHHVVVRSGVYSRGEWAVELWIDGTFEIRRFNINGFMGFPDYIGWRPNYIDGSELETLPLSQAFEGDMTEVVFYNHSNVASHDISRNYYAFMGWSPIVPAPMEATAALTDSKGKGSQKRALYLYWNRDDEVFQTGDPVEYSLSFDPMPGFVSLSGTPTPNPLEPVGDYHGFKVFAKGIRLAPGFTSYRDPLTDDPSLINLVSDVDMDEFDVIMFKDWPDEGKELDDIELNFPGQKDRLLRQLREVNDDGIGLYVTNPRLAVDLGIVDRVEYVSPLTDHKFNNAQGAAIGLYDYGSALKFPWNISASDGLTGGEYAIGIGETQILSNSFLENKAYFYHDTNNNNRFRVRAVVDGLTDLPGYMIEDAVWHVDYDQYGWQGAAYKYLKREDGLFIGDEYIYYGSEVINAKALDIVERRYNRFNGTWATPSGHVKTGTVVTTFGSKHWSNNVLVDNPYKDYATTIVVQPGDTLNGTAVSGRIFVNFSEQTSYGLGAVVQEYPDDPSELPYLYPQETTAQREWDYSWTRTSLTSSRPTASNPYVSVEMPDGSIATFRAGGREREDLTMVRSTQLFPISGKPRMEMTGRGMYWLAAAEEVDPDAVVVRATPMNVTVTAPQPQVTGRKQATVGAQPMFASVDMPRVDEDDFGDVVIRPLPFMVEATFTGYGKTYTAEPMLVDAEIVEPFDAVHAEGEQVALILHSFEATLYLKEEA